MFFISVWFKQENVELSVNTTEELSFPLCYINDNDTYSAVEFPTNSAAKLMFSSATSSICLLGIPSLFESKFHINLSWFAPIFKQFEFIDSTRIVSESVTCSGMEKGYPRHVPCKVGVSIDEEGYKDVHLCCSVKDCTEVNINFTRRLYVAEIQIFEEIRMYTWKMIFIYWNYFFKKLFS